MYQALYRKYRPKDFDSVVGQDSIIKTLKNSIINNNFSHAYMFFGSRGTGKTTVSKIFARNVNCLNPKDGLACGKCENCLDSFSNECVDIIEIDAASNNGVDEIRELRNNIHLVPNKLKYKVYIIDEFHMLSDGAFNALLKTLEEPPEHVIFILATTDPQKVPETIVSRCQCFSFKRISTDVIISKLSEIVKAEKIKIDDDVLKKIALLSDGGLRDSIVSLDKLVSYTSDKITIDDFNDLNGIISDQDVHSFLSNIFSNNIDKVLLSINDFNSCGKNLIQIIIQIINYSRDLIVDYYLNGTELEFSLDLLQNFTNLLNEKLTDIKKSGNTKIYLEMLLLKFMKENCDNSLYVHNNVSSVQKIEDNNTVCVKNVDIVENTNSDINNNVNEDTKSSSNTLKEPINEVVEKRFAEDEGNNIVDDVSNNVRKILNINEIMDARINNTFVSASKDLLQLELKNFDLLRDYSFDQEVGYLVNSILDSKIRAVGSNDLIISYDSDALVDENLVNIVSLNDVYNKITNSNKNIAIVSDDKWNSLKNEYIYNLKNNIKYNLIDEPDIVFEEIEKDDIIINSAISRFGDDIVEVD